LVEFPIYTYRYGADDARLLILLLLLMPPRYTPTASIAYAFCLPQDTSIPIFVTAGIIR